MGREPDEGQVFGKRPHSPLLHNAISPLSLSPPQSWTMLEVFKWMAAVGDIAPEEMARTFNLGLGMCLVVSEAEKAYIMDVRAARRSAAREVAFLLL